MEGTGNGEQGHVPFGVVLDEEIDYIAFSIDHVCRVDRAPKQSQMDERTRNVRPKVLSAGNEPVTLSSDAGSGSGSRIVSSATGCG